MKLHRVRRIITGIIIAIICSISFALPSLLHADVYSDVTNYTTSVTASVISSTAKFILVLFNIHPENAKVPKARRSAAVILHGTSTLLRSVKK